MTEFDREGGRALHWKLLPSRSGWDDAKDAWALAQRAEDARLLYVGLTRARHALWLASGLFCNHDRSPLLHMVTKPDALAASLGDAVAIDDSTPPTSLPWLPPASTDAVPPARIATRTLASDWWVYSFTQLANAEGQADATASATQPAAGGLDEPAADAEVDADADVFDPRFAGPRFGVVLHDVLERTDFAQWSAWTPGTPAPTAEDAALIAERLRAGGYPGDAIDDGIAVLTPLIGHTLTVPLPEGVRLADVPAPQRRPEIEFQFALAPTRVDALLALLNSVGVRTDKSSLRQSVWQLWGRQQGREMRETFRAVLASQPPGAARELLALMSGYDSAVHWWVQAVQWLMESRWIAEAGGCARTASRCARPRSEAARWRRPGRYRRRPASASGPAAGSDAPACRWSWSCRRR